MMNQAMLVNQDQRLVQLESRLSAPVVTASNNARSGPVSGSARQMTSQQKNTLTSLARSLIVGGRYVNTHSGARIKSGTECWGEDKCLKSRIISDQKSAGWKI